MISKFAICEEINIIINTLNKKDSVVIDKNGVFSFICKILK